MAAVLHLLKGDDTELAAERRRPAAGRRRSTSRWSVLPGAATLTPPAGVDGAARLDDLPTTALLELIFEADQVVTW